jgi:hypothetical protein
MERYPAEPLLYRRQFVIGPRLLEEFPSWTRLTIGPFCVTAHPDLSTCQVSDGEFSLLLLGYILDPEQWQLDDEAIMRALLPELAGGRLVRALSRLGGRWVVVANTSRETLVFNDAFGMRQVHYTESLGEQWCAAQPGVLATTLGLPTDERAVSALGHCANKEFWLPGPRTLYGTVARLMPNHSLELRSGRVERYWPDEPYLPRPLDEAVEACSSVTRGLFRAAHARFALAQTITAGWDSRLSLAASRAISPDVLYFSMQYWNMPNDYRDLAVPAALLPTLGLKHHIIKCPDVMEPAFERLYLRNVQPAHYAYGTITQGIHDYGLGDRVCVKSCVANLLKTDFVLPASFSLAAVRARDLLAPTWLAPSAFLIDSVDEWLQATAPSLNGFDVSEVFYWEHWLGGWQAATQHEWEIVFDIFDPVNCRSLMSHLLSVPRGVRSSPNNLIHRRAIEQMWPEALSAPVNPHASAHSRSLGVASIRRIFRPLVTALRGAGGTRPRH